MQQDDVHFPPTEMLYMTYDGNWMLECESVVLGVTQVNDDTTMTLSIVLDRTVLHAQGGGQPTDTGKLILLNPGHDGMRTVVQISKVLLDRSTGVATHTGTIQVVGNDDEVGDNTVTRPMQLPKVGDAVKVIVDEENRRILSECHTAGHVVDSAMARCGKLLKPSKAYHFLEGPYVEYAGSIPDSDRDTVLTDLQTAFCQLVTENIDTQIQLLPKEEADAICNRQAQNFDMDVFCNPLDSMIRVVTVAGYPCPCGGTHVRSTGELAYRQWNITAVKSKKGIVRVKYGQGVQSTP